MSKEYRAPIVTDLGTVEELTEQGTDIQKRGSSTDTILGQTLDGSKIVKIIPVP